MKPVRLGFIGLGLIPSSAHLPGLAPLVENGEVVLQAFCDVNEETLEKQAKAFGPRATYNHHQEMLDKEELDAIYLCIPPTKHTDELLLTADKGLAIFVEKPQSLDMSRALEYNAAVEKSGIITQVGFVNRYEPSAVIAREILQQRTLRHALVQAIYSGKPQRYWTSRYELSGGSFVENTIHRVDLLRYLTNDDVETISAFYVARKPGDGPEPMNLPHVYNVNYRFVSGITANATTSRVMLKAKLSRRKLLVISDDSLLEWSSANVVENGEIVWEAEENSNAFALQAKAFIEAVKTADASKTRSPYADGINSLAAVLGANLSAERGGELVQVADMVSGRVNYRAPDE